MTPPIKVWRNVSIVVLGGAVCLILYFSSTNSPFAHIADHYYGKIKAFHSTGKDTIKVVVLGSSLAMTAFGPAPDVAINCRPVKILRLTIAGLTMEGVEALGILEVLADFPPDYLFFESNLFVLRTEELGKWRVKLDYNLRLLQRKWIGLIRGDDLPMNQRIEVMLHNLPSAYFNLRKDNRYTEIRSSIRYELVENEQYKIGKYLKKLIQNDCKIVLLRYPVIEVNSYKRIIFGLFKKIEGYKAKYGVFLWEMPGGKVDDNMFFDGAHMNRLGSRVFVPWFSDRLNQEICNN